MLFTGDGEVGAVKWTVQTLKTYFEEQGEEHFFHVFVFVKVFSFVFLVLIGFVCSGLYSVQTLKTYSEEKGEVRLSF